MGNAAIKRTLLAQCLLIAFSSTSLHIHAEEKKKKTRVNQLK